MSENKALVIVENARKGGALVYAPQNMDCPPLYKVEATVITAKPEEFFNIQGKYMPSKAVVDRIGEAAGVDFIAAQCSVRTEKRDDDLGNRTVFIGYAQGRTRLPDGTWRSSSVEDYEFDPLLRAQMEAKTDADIRKKYLEYSKVARQRASTGARVRVIRQLTGMPVTFTHDDMAKPLVFTRVVQNTDYILADPKGRAMAIAMATGAAQMMYGQQAVAIEQDQTSEFNDEPEAPMRNATPAATGDDFDDIPFGAEPEIDPRITKIIATLSEWTQAEDARVAGRARKVLDSGDVRLAVLEPALELIKYLGNAPADGKVKGGAQCVTALDMNPLDPVILADVAAKVRNVQGAA